MDEPHACAQTPAQTYQRSVSQCADSADSLVSDNRAEHVVTMEQYGAQPHDAGDLGIPANREYYEYQHVNCANCGDSIFSTNSELRMETGERSKHICDKNNSNHKCVLSTLIIAICFIIALFIVIVYLFSTITSQEEAVKDMRLELEHAAQVQFYRSAAAAEAQGTPVTYNASHVTTLYLDRGAPLRMSRARTTTAPVPGVPDTRNEVTLKTWSKSNDQGKTDVAFDYLPADSKHVERIKIKQDSICTVILNTNIIPSYRTESEVQMHLTMSLYKTNALRKGEELVKRMSHNERVQGSRALEFSVSLSAMPHFFAGDDIFVRISHIDFVDKASTSFSMLCYGDG